MTLASRTLGTLLLVGGLLASPALAQKSDLKRALPASTLMFFTLPDLDASIAEMHDLPLLKMWREEEVQAFFAEALKRGMKEWAKGLAKAREEHKKGTLPFDPDELLKLRVHGLTFALTGFKIEMAQDKPIPDFGVMLHLELGDSAPIWRKVVEFGLQALEAQAPPGMVIKNTAKIGNVETIELVPQVGDVKNSLSLAWLGTGLLIATRASEFKSAIETLADKEKAVLTATESYRATAKNLTTAGAELEVFAQPGLMIDAVLGALKVAAEHAPELQQVDFAGVENAIEALGLRSLKSVGCTSAYENGRSVSKTYLSCPAPARKGLLKGLFAGGASQLDLSFLKWVPKDAVSFSGTTLDFVAMYDAMLAAVKAYSPHIAEMAEQHLAAIEKQIGFSVKEDLFGSLGNQFVLWSMPMAATIQTPEWAIVVKMRDEAKFMKALQAITKLSEGVLELDAVERQGVKMQVVHINFDPSTGMANNPMLTMLVPTFAFKDGHMALGFSAGNVKRVLDRMDRKDDPKGDIRGNAEFAAYAGKLPQDGLASLSFSDWKASFESYYQLLAGALAFVPLDNLPVPIDLSLLPDASSLTKHLMGSVSWSASDGNGITWYDEGPFGPETQVPIVVGVVGAVAVFGGMRARAAQPRFVPGEIKDEDMVIVQPASRPTKPVEKKEPKKQDK